MGLTRNAMRLLRNNNWSQIRQMSGAHSDDGWKIWKKVFFLVAIPVIVVGHVNAFVLPDASEHDPPPFVPYDHLRIRTKKFPWGDGNHSFIHNSHVNALPDGYRIIKPRTVATPLLEFSRRSLYFVT